MKFANWTKNLSPSAMQKSLEVDNFSEYISFALGLPDETTLPAEFCSSIKFTQQNLQYSPTSHLLKTHITKIMKMRGVICKEEEIFITSGAQQGIGLMTKLLCNDGDNIIVENLTYPGFIQAAQTLNVNLISISTNYDTGIDLEELEIKIKSLNKKPAFIYIVADGSNPTGNSLTIKKRQELIGIALKHDVPILEDDPYGLLYYEQNYPALKSFSSSNVCYVGSFSKVIAPSLRVGWIVIPSQLIKKLSILKESFDIHTQTLSQKVVLEFLEKNKFETHLKNIRNLYRRKRNLMVDAIMHHLQDKVILHKPNNGICLWIRFDNQMNSKEILIKGVKNKLLFIPGNDFNISNNLEIAANCARLNFSHCKLENINKGIKILSTIVS
jgi:2-aminoadipate transaminase